MRNNRSIKDYFYQKGKRSWIIDSVLKGLVILMGDYGVEI